MKKPRLARYDEAGNRINTSPLLKNDKKADWYCKCGRKNAYYNTSCACGLDRFEGEIEKREEKKEEEPKVVVKPKTQEKKLEERLNSGGWLCTCGEVNKVWMDVCKCGVSKQEAMETHKQIEEQRKKMQEEAEKRKRREAQAALERENAANLARENAERQEREDARKEAREARERAERTM
jgi:hypothetical protein